MSTATIFILTAITLYLIWLIVFLLVVERWLRRLVEWVFGVTIDRNFDRPVGKVELLDGLFVFSWKVAQPASLGTRFIIGLLRFLLWMAAVITPVLIGIAHLFRGQPIYLITDLEERSYACYSQCVQMQTWKGESRN